MRQLMGDGCRDLTNLGAGAEPIVGIERLKSGEAGVGRGGRIVEAGVIAAPLGIGYGQIGAAEGGNRGRVIAGGFAGIGKVGEGLHSQLTCFVLGN